MRAHYLIPLIILAGCAESSHLPQDPTQSREIGWSTWALPLGHRRSMSTTSATGDGLRGLRSSMASTTPPSGFFTAVEHYEPIM